MRWNNKAQGAMEFLMTYGWALLLTIVVIGALVFYLGVDSRFLSNTGCYMQPGFYCGEYRADEGSVIVSVTNSLGRDLAEISISHGDCARASDNPSLDDDKDVFLTISDCDFGVAGDYMEEELTLSYRFLSSTIYHLSEFTVGAILEGGNFIFSAKDGLDEYKLEADDFLPINDGLWHHFVFVFDEVDTNSIYAFVDGVQESTVRSILPNLGHFGNAAEFKVGKRQTFFAGTVDEVRLSDFARY